MIECEDITPRNAKGQKHGYWERYYANNQLGFRCVFINDKENGFEEWYNDDGKIKEKYYYL